MFLKKYIGDRSFYKMVVGIALPIVVQNGVSTFVNMLDNIMVGRVGTEAMSGVSIVNQFLLVFNLMIFGAVSAAGIFMAQFHGNRDYEGERHTFRFKMLMCVAAGILGIVVFSLLSDWLINLFLQGEAAEGDIALTLAEGRKYLYVMLFGLIPFAVANAYASSMRETGDTVTPMFASIAAVVVNFVFNYILIFGSFGAPALGVTGAAIATVLSRVAECLILVIFTHVHPDRYHYIAGAYRSFRIPGKLARNILLGGMPLIANETLWSLGVAMTNQCYSTRGLDVVAAQNIYSVLGNLFSVGIIAMGNAISIVVGNLLGAGKLDEARDTDRKMIALSVVCGAVMGGLLAACSGAFPLIYNTSDSVRSLAGYMILVAGVLMPFDAFANASYFTLRSGGQIFITMLFDSVFMWVVTVPLCMILSRTTAMDIHFLFAIGQGQNMLKSFLGVILLKKGTWVRQLVGSSDAD